MTKRIPKMGQQGLGNRGFDRHYSSPGAVPLRALPKKVEVAVEDEAQPESVPAPMAEEPKKPRGLVLVALVVAVVVIAVTALAVFG